MAKIEPDDSGLHFYGLGFDGSVVNVMLMLLAGARLVMRGLRFLFFPNFFFFIILFPFQKSSDWLSLIHDTNIGFFTPSVVQLLDPALKFKLVLVGGEALPLSLLQVKWRLLNIYGPTETTVISSARILSASDHVVSGLKKKTKHFHFSHIFCF